MAFGNGDFVNADDAGPGGTGTTQLFGHVLLLQFLDRMPIEEELLGHLLNGGLTTPAPHKEGKPLGVQRIVSKPVQSFVFHAPAP